jgi:hypothetical protein
MFCVNRPLGLGRPVYMGKKFDTVRQVRYDIAKHYILWFNKNKGYMERFKYVLNALIISENALIIREKK